MFEKLVELLEECARGRKECRACPHLPECLKLWDEVVVNYISSGGRRKPEEECVGVGK